MPNISKEDSSVIELAEFLNGELDDYKIEGQWFLKGKDDGCLVIKTAIILIRRMENELKDIKQIISEPYTKYLDK